MKSMDRILVDYREPDHLIKELKKQASKLEYEVEILKAELKSYDIVFLTCGLIAIGAEIKRIETKDFKQSLLSDLLKNEVDRFKDRDNFSYLSIVGDLDSLSHPLVKAVHTLKAELDMIGVKTDLIINDTFFAFHFIRLCQFYSGEKEIRFPAYCRPVKTDDSQLTKILKQWKGLGDIDSEYFGHEYRTPLEMLLPPEKLEEVLKIFSGNEALQLSNQLRAHKGKPAQTKPLQKIKEWVRWFIHGEMPQKTKRK